LFNKKTNDIKLDLDLIKEGIDPDNIDDEKKKILDLTIKENNNLIDPLKYEDFFILEFDEDTLLYCKFNEGAFENALENLVSNSIDKGIQHFHDVCYNSLKTLRNNNIGKTRKIELMLEQELNRNYVEKIKNDFRIIINISEKKSSDNKDKIIIKYSDTGMKLGAGIPQHEINNISNWLNGIGVDMGSGKGQGLWSTALSLTKFDGEINFHQETQIFEIVLPTGQKTED
jgi:hypothetical protein